MRRQLQQRKSGTLGLMLRVARSLTCQRLADESSGCVASTSSRRACELACCIAPAGVTTISPQWRGGVTHRMTGQQGGLRQNPPSHCAGWHNEAPKARQSDVGRCGLVLGPRAEIARECYSAAGQVMHNDTRYWHNFQSTERQVPRSQNCQPLRVQ
jgi:hypothetical protein